MIMSIVAEMTLDKILHPSIKKKAQENRYLIYFLNITKIYITSAKAIILFNRKTFEVFPLRPETRQGSPLLFSIVLE